MSEQPEEQNLINEPEPTDAELRDTDDVVDDLEEEIDEELTEESSESGDPSDTEESTDPASATGAAGPRGTGIEGAEDALREQPANPETDEDDEGLQVLTTQPGGGPADASAAAEQGNREGDEMDTEE